jgi:putative DNA-invertase from lambdoid prophage Rac
MAIYGYTRVSTTKQSEEGLSLEVQKRQIEAYCQQQVIPLVLESVYVEEAVSGSKPLLERKEGSELNKTLKSGDILIASKLDRLFRSAVDALTVTEDLRKRGVAVHLLDLGGDVAGNGMAKLFLTISAAFAEAERDRIRERIINVKDDQKKQGKYLGGKKPFGYSIDENGSLVSDEEEQKAIVAMVEIRKSGTSLRKIAEFMNIQGFDVSHSGVKKIINGYEVREELKKHKEEYPENYI